MTGVRVRLADDSEQEWVLVVDEGPEVSSAEVRSPEGAVWAASAPNLWTALVDVRRQVDSTGVLLGLNAARPEVQPSRMSLQMGGGRLAYRVELGRQAGRDDLVDVLEPAPLDAVGTVAEQEAFRARWFASLG